MEKRKITRGEWVALAVCAALIAVLFATGILNRGKVWDNVQLEGDCSLSLEEGDAYGTVGGGPHFNLPVGEYLLRWRIDADGENVIRFANSNDAKITPSQVVTNPDYWEDEVVFTVEEPVYNFCIFIDFASGTRMQLDDMRMYSPEYTDGTWLAAFLLLGGWLLCVLWRRIRDEEGRRTFALLLFSVAVISVPMLSESIPKAFDTEFHAARIMNLADGLLSGQLPVRVGGYSYNGYGAATSAFYPDLLLYPLALMVLGGASITFVLSVFAVAINLLTAAVMYAAARRLLGTRLAAACAAILYECALYRLDGLYCRLMAGQVMALAVLPLFLLGLWEVCWGDKRRWLTLAAGAALIFQCHMLTTVLCAVLALGVAVLRLPALLRERRLGVLFKAAGVTLLLSLWTLAPFVMLYRSGVNTPAMQFGFLWTVLNMHDVLLPDGRVGLPLLLGAVLFFSLKRDEPGELGKRRWQMLRLCALAGTAAMLMTTKLFPWSYVLKLMGQVVVFQFAWRFLTYTTVLLALCGGFAYARVLEDGRRALTLVLALSLLCAGPYLRSMIEDSAALEFGQGPAPYMLTPEYQIEGTDVGNTRSHAVLAEGDVTLTQYEKRGTQVSAVVKAETDAALTLPLFGFDGYAAEVEGQRMEVGLGDNNRLTVALPAGTSGTLRVWYEGKAVWRVCDMISLATLAAVLVCAARRRRKKGAAPGEACD